MGETHERLAPLELELDAREVAPLALLAVWLGMHPEAVPSYLHAPVVELLQAGVLS